MVDPLPPRAGAAPSRTAAVLTVTIWFVGSASFAADPVSDASIVARFTGLDSARGQAVFLLFDTEDPFPEIVEGAARRLVVPIVDGAATARFERLAPGRYAISALHDRDADGSLDTNWLGFPAEPFGVSLVAKGVPSWERSSLVLEPGAVRELRIAVYDLAPFR